MRKKNLLGLALLCAIQISADVRDRQSDIPDVYDLLDLPKNPTDAQILLVLPRVLEKANKGNKEAQELVASGYVLRMNVWDPEIKDPYMRNQRFQSFGITDPAIQERLTQEAFKLIEDAYFRQSF
jgi:hypothetical protein